MKSNITIKMNKSIVQKIIKIMNKYKMIKKKLKKLNKLFLNKIKIT